MRLHKGSSGSTNAGIKTLSGNAKRPPKLRKRVANDFLPDKARSAIAPPPTKDTTYRRGN